MDKNFTCTRSWRWLFKEHHSNQDFFSKCMKLIEDTSLPPYVFIGHFLSTVNQTCLLIFSPLFPLKNLADTAMSMTNHSYDIMFVRTDPDVLQLRMGLCIKISGLHVPNIYNRTPWLHYTPQNAHKWQNDITISFT